MDSVYYNERYPKKTALHCERDVLDLCYIIIQVCDRRRLDMTDSEMIKEIYEEMQKVKRELRSLQLTLENETNRNIALIAEGHLDLCRKLDDALKVENEKEMLLIRVNTLENEVRKLKERISNIA